MGPWRRRRRRRRLLLLLLLLRGGGAAASGPHSLRYFLTAMTEPSPGLPAFVSVGYVDRETFLQYDSEMQRMVPRVGWMEQEGQDYWDRQTQIAYGNQQFDRVGLDTLQKHYNQSRGYHIVQAMYSCDLLEDGGIWGFLQAMTGRTSSPSTRTCRRLSRRMLLP